MQNYNSYMIWPLTLLSDLNSKKYPQDVRSSIATIPASWKLRKEDSMFEFRLGYIVRPISKTFIIVLVP